MSRIGKYTDRQSRPSGIRHRFNAGESFLYSRHREDDECQSGFRAEIDPVVGEGVEWGAHPIVCGVASEEDHAGEEGEEIAAQNAKQIAFDQAVLFIAEDAGESQCAESEQIVCEHLRDADDIGIDHKL